MTLGKVAEQAGVAPDTARRALRNEPSVRPYIRERVMRAAEQLDYHPNLIARALRDKNVNLTPISMYAFSQYYFGMLAYSFARKLVDIGMEPALCYDSEHMLRVCKSFRARGCLLAFGVPRELAAELGRTCKLVTLNANDPEFSAGNVVVDLRGAYRRLARRLLETGRRRVAFVSGEYTRGRRMGWPHEKFPVVLGTLKKEGLAPAGGDVFESAEAFGAWLAGGRKKVDAVLCEEDLTAAKVAGEIARMGLRTPEDALVVGCDANLMLPGTWSVKLDTEVIAGMAVDLLRRALDREGAAGSVVYKPELVEGPVVKSEEGNA